MRVRRWLPMMVLLVHVVLAAWELCVADIVFTARGGIGTELD
jgi:hypothetical protein